MNSRKALIIICIVLSVSIIGGFAGNHFWKEHQKKLYYAEKRDMFEERNEVIQTLLPEEFPALCGAPSAGGCGCNC